MVEEGSKPWTLIETEESKDNSDTQEDFQDQYIWGDFDGNAPDHMNKRLAAWKS